MESEQVKRKILDSETARLKIEQYCAYQERSQQEVRDRLYNYGLHQQEVEEIISELISNNFLNEERFAIAYALGKFRIKGWGKLKIKHGLKLKRVGDKLINKAILQIDGEQYVQTLAALLSKKAALLRDRDMFTRKQKLLSYASSRGYEKDLIFDCLNSSDLFQK